MLSFVVSKRPAMICSLYDSTEHHQKMTFMWRLYRERPARRELCAANMATMQALRRDDGNLLVLDVV